MAKSSVQDIARYISGKRDIAQKDAEQFVKNFFEIVGDTLQREPLVKVKGLGTFKVVDVKDRESVDVNTGERIVIEGRSKISFTPDNVMKELVNKPFSQFETVVVNDGVEFPEEEEEEKEEKVVEENMAEEKISEEKVVEEKVVVEPAKVAEIAEIPESAEPSESTEQPSRMPWILALIATAVIMFCAGYFVGKGCGNTSAEKPAAPVAAVDTTAVADTAAVDTVKAKAPEVVAPKATPAPAEKPAPAPAAKDVSPAMQQAMNIVATGAYVIEGTQEEVIVRAGQTISKISKHYLGDGLDSYVKVHNGVTEVKEGMKIKIPKLKVKKKKK